MCGIIGYVGARPCRDVLLAGLEKLEYRGYDSAGISVLEGDGVASVRAVGNLANLHAAIDRQAPRDGGGVALAAPPATIGLAHTRWATHGRVTEANAHPHSDTSERIHIVRCPASPPTPTPRSSPTWSPATMGSQATDEGRLTQR